MGLITMKRISIGWSLILALLASPLLASAQGIEGKFTAVGPLPPRKSANTVVVEEFLNFTCPHCNNFREVAKPVLEKYGKRVKLVHLPLLFRGQADAPLRLFFVAQEQGKEDVIVNALFDAAFKSNVNVYDPAVVNYLARTNGLAQAYQKDGNAAWVTQRIAAVVARANTFQVDSTPTLVLQGAMKMSPETRMEAFVSEMDGVIGQLLK
jgi:predicted DsbA family dithiol-disulfide isomerase